MTLDTLQPFEQSFTVSPTTSTPATAASTKADENYLLETFHQYPHGDFRPTFYNPFEIKHRRRTSRAQLKVLEKSYLENPKPSAAIRRILAQKLEMTPRGVQIWFQNRRAKAKLLRRKSSSSSTPSAVVAAAAAVETEQDEHLDQQHHTLEHFDGGMNAINTSLNTSDINQSSILFSQFFTNNYAVVGAANVAPVEAEEEDWSVWQLNDNVRTVATTAAAVAAASSSCQQQHYEMRRRSCPVMPPPPRQHQQQQINMTLNQPQASYLSPAWSPNMLCNIMPPQQQQQQYNKRNFSYDSNSFDLLAYSQHTPPLTASCSASTVAGSPISLDNLYMNDPVVLPTNQQYYNQSPLSATTTYMPDYTMPQFI
ncbi:Homeodomain-like DNA binding domain-containing transcription factor [Mucor lusitanicus]|uniref:Homeodomain-like DNA binding domain-containing transcription factor n=2 Tax=Mucor circinelloides f. lusitanicus TaxID=29924 RepID=A0A168HUC0_MUCCL|nr:Homeodomain-like DNA binding domain-containing transcription factor [Mucor lusitanicus CBS 277.49]